MFREINKDLSGELGQCKSIRQQILSGNSTFHAAYAKEAFDRERRGKQQRKRIQKSTQRRSKYFAESDKSFISSPTSSQSRNSETRRRKDVPKLIFPSGINDL